VVVASSATDWATVAVTAFLGLVTIFVGLSIHLKRRQEIAAVVTQKGYEAYSSLWELIPYSPELQELQPKQRLKPEDRDDLFDKMTAWYYGSGRGMMLGDDTRGIYLTAKKNLICKVGEFVPASARKQIGESEEERTRQCVRQLSLLRSAMRADFEVLGKPWGREINDRDRQFILEFGARPSRLMRSRSARLRERLREVRHPPQKTADREGKPLTA
jgi:hypothetical protein